MALFKCKMCGGSLEVTAGATVIECEYCGTQQTLPRLDDDRKTNLYDRANHFRRNNDFDKAMGIYEQILNEDSTDAEAYWSIVLCRYGIEYVEDPASHKRIPTVNRAQFTSIFDDNNYKSALQYADAYQRHLYEEEAKAINEIQKGILAISQKEEPFDVFICYKESDNNGRRTPDSVLAQELYYQLKQEGFKVFFARITLEDKLGSAYEPYIFAALNSAKVMVVLGTKPEFFNAVWVKNEWSRYLALIKGGAQKMLIPAYKDMDPYDLPEEFSHLQAQDMSKLGFMQDLTRGIKKIVQTEEPKQAVVKETVVAGGSVNTAPLLKRAFMFLEDGEWNSADEYCEKVLDIEPENAMAYLGKLMAELRVKTQEDLSNCEQPFDNRNNYQKVLRFGDDNLATTMKGYISHINIRNENARLEGLYIDAVNTMRSANTEDRYKYVANLFEAIIDYKDSATLRANCLEKAEVARKDAVYTSAKARLATDGNSITSYEKAINMLKTISEWKDASEQIDFYQRKIEEIRKRQEEERLEAERQAEIARVEAEKKAERERKFTMLAGVIFIATIGTLVLMAILREIKYSRAEELLATGHYVEAAELFDEIIPYRDSEEKSIACRQVGELATSKEDGYVYFGTYEQDNISNGKEEIEWIVLAEENDKILLMSVMVLDTAAFNDDGSVCAWETSSIREWLNNSFYEMAFSSEIRDRIVSTIIVTQGENSSKNTFDKVFLLSDAEVEKYLVEEQRKKVGTSYACAGGYEGSWWLRSQENAYPQRVYDEGNMVNSWTAWDNSHGVCPAIWVSLEQ